MLKLFIIFMKSDFTPEASLKCFCLWFTPLCSHFVLFLESSKRVSSENFWSSQGLFCPKIKFVEDLFSPAHLLLQYWRIFSICFIIGFIFFNFQVKKMQLVEVHDKSDGHKNMKSNYNISLCPLFE